METAPIVVTTPVPGVNPTQTYLVSASTLPPVGAGPIAGATVTVPAFSVLLASTAFEYPNVVLGTVAALLGGELAPPPGATAPWGSSLRLPLQGFSLAAPVVGGPTPTDIPGAVPTTPNTTPAAGSAATTKGSIPTSPLVGQSSSPGLGAGAVAGVAIGCLVAGALVAFAIAFFCLKRRRSKQYDGDSPASTTVVTSDLKGFHVPPPVADGSPLDKFLLDSTSDKEMAAELHALGTLIQSHTENNYHSGAVLVNRNTLSAALAQLGVQRGGSLGPSELASLALAPATRQVALQHVISQVVFTSIDTSSRSQLSMLPSPIAAFLQSIPPPEGGNTADGKFCHLTSIALNKWRVLSAFLLHPARSQRTPLPASSPAIAAQADSLADALNRFLQYFVSGDDQARAQQTNHLKDVIVECTKLGYTVLSQPSDWRFVHTPGQGAAGHTAVLCAGLAKVTRRDGTPLSSPNEVVAPTIVRV
ncbi:hypothetical protein B0T18DRAFT_314869 [Schizothecium vesticola]|uniref:Uncharacterized protein n=1 Tax=Schizothecium vesticola TaxID=314040 RepID=A0AA40KBT2_9PEZI|nr:hypothetical protein B0T18DRAFT_314869 [Schizothecium vesticola]